MKRTLFIALLVLAMLALPGVAQGSHVAGQPGGEQVFSTGSTFSVEILPRSAAFTDLIFLDQPGPAQFIDDAANLGNITGPFGPFAAGTELVFRVDVTNTGLSYFTGPGSRNPDGFEHAIVTMVAPGVADVFFEDLPNLGDHDFFDADFRLTGVGNAAIDIKPGSFPNSINVNRTKGVIPVALLGSASLDVTTIDVTTLAFGPGGAAPAHDLSNPATYAEHLQDVNNDGLTDLVSHYPIASSGISAGDTSACVTALTTGGALIYGCDSVRTVGS
jgi:hypothetical protein